MAMIHCMTEESISEVVRARVGEIRKLRRLAQKEVAERMADIGFAWHRQTVGQVEAGTRKLTVDEVVGLAAVLGTTVRQLLSPISLEPDVPAASIEFSPGKPLEKVWAVYGFGPPDR